MINKNVNYFDTPQFNTTNILFWFLFRLSVSIKCKIIIVLSDRLVLADASGWYYCNVTHCWKKWPYIEIWEL